jgi:hypothetical protein
MRIATKAIVMATALLASLLIGTSASARTTQPDQAGELRDRSDATQSAGSFVRLPSASLSTSSGPLSTSSGPAPTTSPAAKERYWASGGGFYCYTGYVCATVPYEGGYYVFKFYNYGTYRLSSWYGLGRLINNQSGGASARLQNKYGDEIGCMPRGEVDINWDPIWYLQLTIPPC